MRLSDERGIIAASLIRTVVVLALIGLAAIETSAILFARLQAQDVAETAAAVGAGTYRDSQNVEAARATANTAMLDKDRDVTMISFEVFSDGRVRVVVVKEANTLLVQRIGFLKDLHIARGRHTADPPAV
ncbi:MAG TPA: hypothetical protein VGB28_02105 [Actinomycetota bacterium]|jgi:hypothetical protein